MTEFLVGELVSMLFKGWLVVWIAHEKLQLIVVNSGLIVVNHG